MRICLVTSSYPRSAADSINAGVFVRDFALAARDAGHAVSVITHRKAGGHAPDPGIELIEYNWLGRATSLTSVKLKSPLGPLRAASLLLLGGRALRRHLARRGADAVLAFWAIPGGLIARRACLRSGVPYATWALGSDIWRYERSRLVGPLLRRVLRDSAALYADGTELAQRVSALDGRECAFVASARRLPDPPRPAQLEPGCEHLLYVGRYHPNKGPDVLLAAMPALLKQRPALRLHMFGQGELQPELERQIARLGLEKAVSLSGFIQPEPFAALLDAVQGLVVPSRLESVPVVLSDAAQRGAPLAVSDVGDMGELVRQHNAGEVCRPEDPADLARAIATLLDNGRESYAQGVAALAERFSVAASMRRIVSDLERLPRGVGRAGCLERAATRLIAGLGRMVGAARRPALRLSGKGRGISHPKHLLPPSPDHHWYLQYLQPGMRVLDLGCDRGGHARQAAAAGTQVIGAELDAAAVRAANAERGGPCYLRADLERPQPFADRAFAAVLALDVIEHLDKREALLGEARRVLADDGLLLLSAPNADTPWKRRLARAGLSPLADPAHRVEYSAAGLRAALEAAGFEIRSVEPTVLDTPWAALIDLTGTLLPGLYGRGVAWKRGRALAEPAAATGFRVVARKM